MPDTVCQMGESSHLPDLSFFCAAFPSLIPLVLFAIVTNVMAEWFLLYSDCMLLMCLCGSQPRFNMFGWKTWGPGFCFLPWKVPSMHLCMLRSRREIETLPTTIVLDCFSTSPNWVQFTNCNWPRTNSQKIRFSQLAPAAAQNTKNFRWIVFFGILILSLEVLCFRY